jgi:hypothetical protein
LCGLRPRGAGPGGGGGGAVYLINPSRFLRTVAALEASEGRVGSSRVAVRLSRASCGVRTANKGIDEEMG